jgi:hypothetical protein
MPKITPESPVRQAQNGHLWSIMNEFDFKVHLKTGFRPTDNLLMRKVSLVLALLFLASGVMAQNGQIVIDSNTAFYEGENLRYVFPPAASLKMVTGEAAVDGYSFAFIPKVDDYNSALMIVGVNIYKIRGLSCDSVISMDTSALRTHYGPDVVIRPVDSVFAGSGEPVKTFYIDSKKRFLPNVMVAYYDGKSEIVIFELVIDPNTIRPKAEELFMSCVTGFKALKRGTLGIK